MLNKEHDEFIHECVTVGLWMLNKKIKGGGERYVQERAGYLCACV